VYDRFFENSLNNRGASPFRSLREQLGWDDESMDFLKVRAEVIDDSNVNDRMQTGAPGSGFVVEDATHYYPQDIKRGIFPFLLAEIVMALILLVFPEIATFLPSLM